MKMELTLFREQFDATALKKKADIDNTEMVFKMDRVFVVAQLVLSELFFQHSWGIPMSFKDLGQQFQIPNVPRTWMPDDPACFPDKCPTPQSSEWWELSDRCCQDTKMYYHCQEIDGGRMIRFCMDLVKCPAGTFADLEVIRDRRYFKEPLCQPCPAKEFQPHPTYSCLFKYPRCHNERQNCRKLRAEMISPGSAKADDVCMCPYYHGYRPGKIPAAARDCRTFNSSSGCNCEYMPCPTGKIMTEGPEDQNPQICLDKDCPQMSPEAFWLFFVQDLHRSHGILITGLFAIVVAAVIYCVFKLQKYLRTGRTRYDILVCILFPSSKICEFVFEEIRNSLPLLERLYGPLTLDHDKDSTHITIVVRPSLAKVKFSLMQFIRDLFRTVSIAKYLKETTEDVQIVAVHGTSKEIKTASFKEAALKQTEELAFNEGKVVLQFSGNVDEDQLIRDLKAADGDFKNLFTRYTLKFGGIQRGSIVFRYAFTKSESFDSLAMEQNIKKLVIDLSSNDSFKQLARREDVKVEFICKAKLEAVSVVQAQDLCIQVGMQNNVYINDQQPQPLDENDQDDFLEFEEDTPGRLFSYSVVSLSPRKLAIHRGEENNCRREREDTVESDLGLDPNSRAIPVVVKSDPVTVEKLHAEWSNQLPLLTRIYPSCKMRQAGASCIVWELGPLWRCRTAAYPDITGFVDDLFRTPRITEIRSHSDVSVSVHVSQNTRGIVVSSRETAQKKATEKRGKNEHFNLIACFLLFLMLLVFYLRTREFEDAVVSVFMQYSVLLLGAVYFLFRFLPCLLKNVQIMWKTGSVSDMLGFISLIVVIYVYWF